jgi:hypothetical protein
MGHRIRPLFFIAVIPGAVSVALVFLVRERTPTRAERKRARERRRMSARSAERLPRRYWELLLVLGAFNLANFSDSLLILRTS